MAPDTTVVIYGDTNNWFAAWAAWVFDVYNVNNVKLLDGGRKKWEAENRPLDTRVATLPATAYKVTAVNTQLRAGLSDAVAAANGKLDAKLVDIRSPEEYSGKVVAPQGFTRAGGSFRPHPWGGECALGTRRERRRHLQVGP